MDTQKEGPEGRIIAKCPHCSGSVALSQGAAAMIREFDRRYDDPVDLACALAARILFNWVVGEAKS
jgi:hypothetical protein